MNVRYLLRYLFFLLVAIVVCAVEKNVGLPFFFFLIALIYIESLVDYAKVLAWIVFSFLLASFYMIPFALGFFLLFLLMFIYELPMTLWNRESIKVFFALLINGIILALFTHFRFDFFSGLYHFIVLIGVFLGIRFWFRRRHGGAKLSVAHRLAS
jgi:hypothetical protein